MPKATEVEDLEISDHLEFQRRNWIFERIGWVGLALITAAAVAGLFGRGLLGVAVAESADDRLSVEYHRFWRTQSPMTLRVRVDGRAAQSGLVRIWIGREYLRSFRVSQMLPEPERVEAGSDRVVFVFALTSDAATAEITFDLEPDAPGFLSGHAGLEAGQEVRFGQFIYP